MLGPSRIVSAVRRLHLPRTRRAVALALLAAGMLLGAIAALTIGLIDRRPGSVVHPDAPFQTQALPPPPAAAVPATAAASTAPAVPQGFDWPLYGLDGQHLRSATGAQQLHPPFRRIWVEHAWTLLEFPPVIYGERLYQLGDNGVVHAVEKATGKEVWARRVGIRAASSPAASGTAIYLTVMLRGPHAHGGRIIALRSADGTVMWSRPLNTPSESSPLLEDGRLYFGTQAGTLYALDAANGHLIWTYHAAGAIKASPAFVSGRLYFGDYGGQVQALRARDGHPVWKTQPGGGPFSGSTFYSTAAVIYGRVFLGNTDGRVYALDARTGALDWAIQTGSYVYGAPAVAAPDGLGPTIYIGSYNGDFYALGARNGRIYWRYRTGGKISGGGAVVGRIVYFADLRWHRTIGVGIAQGHRVFELGQGAFDPVVSDGVNLYVTGYSSLYAFTPVTRPAPVPASAATPAAVTRRPRPASGVRRRVAGSGGRGPRHGQRRRRGR